MSAEEFWRDDPQLFVSHRTSFLNKKKREMEEYDYKCWLQGLYIHDGNGKLMMSLKEFIASALGSKDNLDIGTYPPKPYGELEKDKLNEKKKKEEEKKNKYNEFQSSLAYLGTMKKRFRESIKKGE